MDDNYLDKKLKGILESPPELEPDPAAVLDMKQRLSKLHGRERRGFVWWPVIALLGLLAGGYLIFLFQGLNRKVNTLNEQLTLLTLRDTLVEHRIVYRIDTIYQTIYRDRIGQTQAIPYFNTSSSYYLKANHLPIIDIQRENTNLGWGYRDPYNLSLLTVGSGDSSFFPVDEDRETAKEAGTIKSEVTHGVLAPINSGLYTRIWSLDHQMEALDLAPDYQSVKQRKHTRQLRYYFTPVDFSLGLKASPVLLFANSLGGYTYSIGLDGEIVYPQQRSLNLAVELLGTKFESKDENRFSDFPVPNPNDPVDRLHELKGNFQYVQVYAGIKQRWLPEARFQPIVSIGLSAFLPIRQELTYEFIGNAGEYSLQEDIRKDRDFSVRNIRFGLGAGYRIGRRFSLEAEGLYQHAFNTASDDYLKLQYWGINLGFRYKFTKK